MEKLNGNKKLKISVFISGRGTNLKSIIKFSKNKNSPIKIGLVISSNKYAKGLIFANNNKIKCLIINYKNKNKAVERNLSEEIKQEFKNKGFNILKENEPDRRFPQKVVLPWERFGTEGKGEFWAANCSMSSQSKI